MPIKRQKTTESISDKKYGEGTRTTYTNRKGRVVKETAHLENNSGGTVDIKARYKKSGGTTATFKKETAAGSMHKTKYKNGEEVSSKYRLPVRNNAIDKLSKNK